MRKFLLLTFILTGGISASSAAQAQWWDPVRNCRLVCVYISDLRNPRRPKFLPGEIWGPGPRRVGQPCQTLVGGLFSLKKGTVACEK